MPYLYSEVEHQAVWVSLCQLIEKISPRRVCYHLLEPSRSLKTQETGLVWFRRASLAHNLDTKPFTQDVLDLQSLVKSQLRVQKSHLSLYCENGVCFLRVKVLYQETLEVIFYSLLDLSGLYTCRRKKEITDYWKVVISRHKGAVTESMTTQRPENIAGPRSLLPTHLDEPLCQQINSLSHSRVVLREELDDMFWRATCLEIPVGKRGFLSSNSQWVLDSCVLCRLVLM